MANFTISALERMSELGLPAATRARLLEMLGVLAAAGSGGGGGGARSMAEWASCTDLALHNSPAPDLPPPTAALNEQLALGGPAPARSELSVYVQLVNTQLAAAAVAAAAADAVASYQAETRAAAAATAASALDDKANNETDADGSGADSAEERDELLADFRDMLQGGVPGGASLDAGYTMSDGEAQTQQGRGRHRRNTTTTQAAPAANALEVTLAPPLPLPPPPPLDQTRAAPGDRPPPATKTERLLRDVAAYAAESLRVHSRLMDLCSDTLARTTAPAVFTAVSAGSEETAGAGAGAGAGTMSAEGALGMTREVLAMLTTAAAAAGGGAPLEAAAAVRDTAAAALRLGLALAEMSGDVADEVGGCCEALRVYVGAALARHPAALGSVRACLAATLLARPFQLLPPLTADASPASGGGGGRLPETPLLDSAGQLRSVAVARRARGGVGIPLWPLGVSAALGLLDDVAADGSISGEAPSGSVGLGSLALPPGAPAAVAVAAAAAVGDLGATRTPAECVGGVLPPSSATLDHMLSALLVALAGANGGSGGGGGAGGGVPLAVLPSVAPSVAVPRRSGGSRGGGAVGGGGSASVRGRSVSPLPSPIAVRTVAAAAATADARASTVATSGGTAAAAAAALALSLARHALALVRTAPLSARHVDALAAVLHLAPSEAGSGGGGGGGVVGTQPVGPIALPPALTAAVASLVWAVLGVPTPLGPSLSDAVLPPPLREGFVRRVIVCAAAPAPALLALAGGWLVAALSDPANSGGVGGGSAAGRLWSAALDTVRNAGWTDGGGGGASRAGGGRFVSYSAFDGWYSEAAAGSLTGETAVRERLELCLFAFHGLPRAARAAAAAEALAVVSGGEAGAGSRGGAVAGAARAHAALLANHCLRHFDRCPRWLVARVQRTIRGGGEGGGGGGAGGGAGGGNGGGVGAGAALAALLVSLDEDSSDAGGSDSIPSNLASAAAAAAAAATAPHSSSSAAQFPVLPGLRVAAVRAAALTLADRPPAGSTGSSAASSPELSPPARLGRLGSALSVEPAGDGRSDIGGGGGGGLVSPSSAAAVSAQASAAVDGKAVQVDPMKPKLTPPGTQRLKLMCDMLLSTSAFKFNLRRYRTGTRGARLGSS